jgi:hypothetical protein
MTRGLRAFAETLGSRQGVASAATMSVMRRTAADRAYELVNGFRASQLVRLASELRIPNLLAEGPLSVEQLAGSTGVHAGRLGRVLRGLAALGVLAETEDGRFKNTDVGDLFREGVAGSQRPLAMMLLPESYRAWDHLMETVRSGTPGHKIAHGGTLWDSMRRDPNFAARFNEAMVSNTQNVAAFVAAGYEFSAASLVVDVGGGNGALVAGILEAHPHLRGMICDLPAGLVGAAKYLEEHGVADRCATVESDFFLSMAPGADVYLLKDIIHDWDDEQAVRILSTCRQAAGSGARILIIERLLPARITDDPTHLNPVMTDLQMMVQLGSRERTAEEYKPLLEAAGWRFEQMVSGDLYGIVEAVAS